MNLRKFIALLSGSAAAWPVVTQGRQVTMPVIGFLHSGTSEQNADRLAGFRKGLSDAGFIENQNVAIDTAERMKNPTIWRHDIDALVFGPDDHHGLCMVHRRAFRTLLRFNPAPGDCEVFFRTNEYAFRAAASAKSLREDVARGVNFHLTSRDVAREMEK